MQMIDAGQVCEAQRWKLRSRRRAVSSERDRSNTRGWLSRLEFEALTSCSSVDLQLQLTTIFARGVSREGVSVVASLGRSYCSWTRMKRKETRLYDPVEDSMQAYAGNKHHAVASERFHLEKLISRDQCSRVCPCLTTCEPAQDAQQSTRVERNPTLSRGGPRCIMQRPSCPT